MGLLDQVLGQVLGGTSARPSSGAGGLGDLLSGNKGPIAMALLALLASKHLNRGAGGQASTQSDAGFGQSSGSGGGLLDRLGGMFGGGGSGSQTSGGLGSLGGSLAGGALAGGLGDLLGRFNDRGYGDVANSWVGHGPNAPLSPHQLEDVLEPGTVDELSRETGLERGDLLSQLAEVLPPVVDKLTPNGRLPSEAEHSQWV